MVASALAGASYSMTVHGPDEFDRPRAIGLAEKIRGTAFVVGASSFTRSQLFRWVESSHWDKVHVVHRGLDHAFHLRQPPPAGVARRLVCVGRPSEQKGLERHDIDVEAGKLGRLRLQLGGAVQ
jgi:hypothetical protein